MPRVRDLLLIDAPGRIVVATDSIGGIGPKPADTVFADAATVAHFALRVPLLEVLSVGARPVAVADALCVEADGIGQVMIETILRLAAEAGVGPDAVTGSTEDNVATTATGIGVTVIGLLPDGATVASAAPGSILLCAGLPLSAPRDAITIGHRDLVAVADVRRAMASGLVRAAVPVGSRGIRAEATDLAAGAVLEWVPSSVAPADSGGPASCVLFAIDPADEDDLRALFPADLPVQVVARVLTG